MYNNLNNGFMTYINVFLIEYTFVKNQHN